MSRITVPALAEVRSVDELQAALRARALSLKLVFDARTRHGNAKGRDCSLDSVSGLPDGYSAKLLAPVPIRSFGRTSLGPMLAALGCKLLLVEDAELLARITARIERDPHANGNASARMLPNGKRKRRYPKLGTDWAIIMNARRYLLVPQGKRRAAARKAAKARWKRPRHAPLVGATGK